jgi:hypothetical protein
VWTFQAWWSGNLSTFDRTLLKSDTPHQSHKATENISAIVTLALKIFRMPSRSTELKASQVR